jgi:uncharacterized protein (DUF427 family)
MQDLLAEARGRLRHEPIERRVRAIQGASTVVDSTRAVLLWEPRRVCPTYAVPAEDIRAELTPAPATNGGVPGVLHPGIPFSVHTADGEPVSIGDRTGAGLRLADEDLAGYVALDFDAFEFYEEDQRVLGHPRDPFHRVDLHQTSRPVRIEVGGELVAESTSARLVSETQLPLRFYLPRDAFRVELEPSSTRSYCPYKGEASYWSFEAGGRRHEDIAWSYESPLADATLLTGLVSFWNDRLDVFIDGEPYARPGGTLAATLRDEFASTARGPSS